MNDFTENGLRKRFKENREKREQILAKSGPLREERDRLSKEMHEKLKSMAQR